MGKRKLLLPLSIVLSALNGLLSLVPFVLVWLVVRTLLTAGGDIAETPIRSYALWAFVVSVATVLLYFGALMLSHLAAFRVETNMRRFAMDRLLRTPLGFFDRQDTGRMRKIIDEDSSMTHTLVAHPCRMSRAALSPHWGSLYSSSWWTGSWDLLPLSRYFYPMV